MTSSLAQPSAIQKIAQRELKIIWQDGHESLYPFRYLRQACRCALCVDEWTGRPILERDSVAENIEGVEAALVGQYALRINFSDGHSTGIFTFEYLRRICPCPVCVSAPREI